MANDVDPEALVSAALAAAKSAARSARSARLASTMTLVAVFVAVLVLALDNGIKRAILAEAARARAILDEFKTTALEALSDGPAGQATADSGATGDGGDALVHPPGPPAATDPDEGDPLSAAHLAAGGAAAGPGGDE